MHGHHIIARVWINRVRFCQSCSWSAEQGKIIFPCPLSRLRIWSRETGSAVPSRVSLFISILRLNLVLTYGIPHYFISVVLVQTQASSRPPRGINISKTKHQRESKEKSSIAGTLSLHPIWNRKRKEHGGSAKRAHLCRTQPPNFSSATLGHEPLQVGRNRVSCEAFAVMGMCWG